MSNKCLSNIVNEKNKEEINEKRMEELISEAKEILKENNMSELSYDEILKDVELLKKATENIIDKKNIQKKNNSIEAKQLRNIVDVFNKGIVRNGSAYKTASAMLVSRMGNERNGISSIELESVALRKIFNSYFSKFYQEYSAGLTNIKRTKEAESLRFLEEIYKPGSTGDAKLGAIVKEYNESMLLLRDEYHANGISLGKIDNYTPQTHDAYKYNKVDLKDYIEDGLKLFDFKKTKGQNGKKLETLEEKEAFLTYVYENIRTNGLHARLQNEVEISDTGVLSNVDLADNVSSIVGRKNLERKIFFKDAKSNHSFNIKYGESNVFDSISLNILESADEIALVRKLSLNPAKGFKLLRELAKREGVSEANLKALDSQEALVNKDKSVTSDPLIAESGKFLRYVATADKVGMYAASQVGDIASSINAKHVIYNKNFISGFVDYVKIPMQIIKGLYKINDKDNIIRMTGIIETLNSRNGVEARINDPNNSDVNFIYAGSKRKNNIHNAVKKANEVLGSHSNALIKISGMKDFTESSKFVAMNELYSNLTDMRFKNYDDLKPNFKKFMEVAGFDRKDFEMLKHLETENYNGAEIITSATIARSKKLSKEDRMNLAIKTGAFAESVSRYSVGEKGFHLTSVIDPTDKGKVSSQVMKMMTHLKTFPLTFFYNQIMGDVRMGDNLAQKSGNLSRRAVGVMAFGYLTFQLKEMVAGREPMEMNEENAGEIFSRSFFYGGGLGIFGDILFNDMTKYGKDGLDYALGPVGSVFKNAITKPNELMQSTVEEFKDMYNEDVLGVYSTNKKIQKEEDSKNNSKLIDTLDNFTSFTNIWYIKEAKQRLFFDALRKEFTESYETDMEREQKILDAKNQEKLWYK